ncbi:MAG: hypothetical protein HY552_01320 [Elusimicrobia bacterium]|nr:hypothetical protein [Elusimicrobiota bacterium]
MRARLFLFLLLPALQGCAVRRGTGFVWQRLTGASAESECFRDGSASVCRWRPKGADEDPEAVVFFLHYATGDERSLVRVGLLNGFYKRYRKAGRKPPRVLSLSYGSHWLISDAPGQRQVVLRGELDALLARLQDVPAKRRYLWGLSMGGYNAAELAFAAPDRWSAAVLSCPALLDVDPFAAPTKGLSRKRRDGLTLFKIRLGGPDVWRSENPLALARRPGPAPSVLIEANASDEFGFFPGAAALASALADAGKPVSFQVRPGGHCAVDGAAAADFFMSL